MEGQFYSHLTDGQLLFLIPAISVSLMFSIAWLIKKLPGSKPWFDYDEDVIDTATSNTMSGAYVVLGFVLVLAMATVTDLDSNVSQEATAIKSLERLLVLDGSPQSMHTRDKLISYTNSILHDEWPVLARGHGSQATSTALNDLYMSLDKLNPDTDKEELIFSKIVDQTERIAALRNARNFSIESTLPRTYYIVSLLSILGVVLICALRLQKASPTRASVLSIQVIMLTLMFSAVVIVDLPYLGDTSTSAEPIEMAYDSMTTRVITFK